MTETARLVLAVDSSSARKATSDLDHLAKTGKRTEGVVKNLRGSMAGLAIGAGVVAGINAIFRNTIEAEKAQAQLNAVIKSTGGAAGLSAKQLNDYADSLSLVSGIDDDVITGGQALLLTFTKIHAEAFPRATEAALDMSVAMGTDLNSAIMQVGKALNSPKEGLSALSRVGVQFTETQKDLIEKLVETGDVAEAQRIILLELETQFGGSAEAARNTLGGALQALQTDFGNLLEGDAGSGGIKDTVAAIDDLGETMRSQSVKDGFAAMIEGLANVASFAAEAIAAVGGLGKAIQDSFAANGEKSRIGLGARRAAVEADLARVEGGVFDKASMFLGGESGVNPFQTSASAAAGLRAELKQIDALLASMRSKQGPSGPIVMEDMVIGPPPAGKPKKAKGAGRTKVDHAAREAERAAREAAEANEDFRRTLEDLRAEMGGPLAQVQLEYARREQELRDLAKAGKVSNEDLAESLSLLSAERQKEVDAINAQKTPTEELLSDMRFEHSLLGMTNAERQTAIDLRQLEGKATAAQAAEIRALNEAYDAEREKIGVMDEFRGSVEDTFASILDGSKSAKEAFTDLADSIVAQIARIIAQQMAAQLFGQPGTSGGGMFGGGIGGFFGALLGLGGGGAPAAASPSGFLGAFSPGGYAMGTTNAPGGVHWVGENGPERVFLPKGSQVEPAHRSRGRKTGDVHLHVQGVLSKETQFQAATRLGRQMRRGQG